MRTRCSRSADVSSAPWVLVASCSIASRQRLTAPRCLSSSITPGMHALLSCLLLLCVPLGAGGQYVITDSGHQLTYTNETDAVMAYARLVTVCDALVPTAPPPTLRRHVRSHAPEQSRGLPPESPTRSLVCCGHSRCDWVSRATLPRPVTAWLSRQEEPRGSGLRWSGREAGGGGGDPLQMGYCPLEKGLGPEW